MNDFAWLSTEAQKIHDIFETLFFSIAGLMLLIGVISEYLNLGLNGFANFSKIILRLIIASVLLIAYPSIANTIADIGDGIAQKIGDINSLNNIINMTLDVLKKKEWSWFSLTDSIVWLISYLVYFILYITVYVFDAIILYGWTVLYVFSPLLILMYILPQTSGATVLLFRSHLELASYKVVWSVLGTLLWSTALQNLNDNLQDKPNFFVVIGFMIIVAFSIIFTPKIVSGLFNAGMSGVSSQIGAISAAGISAGALGPAGLSKLLTKSVTVPSKTGYEISKAGFNKSSSFISNQNRKRLRRVEIKRSKDIPKNVIDLEKYRNKKKDDD